MESEETSTSSKSFVETTAFTKLIKCGSTISLPPLLRSGGRHCFGGRECFRILYPHA